MSERPTPEIDAENKFMREAIKDAHGAISQCLKYILKLPLSGSAEECETMDDAHHALRKLKPFINAVVCDGPAILICSMCEGVTTIRLLKAGWPRVRCPQCRGTGKIVSRSHTAQDHNQP